MVMFARPTPATAKYSVPQSHAAGAAHRCAEIAEQVQLLDGVVQYRFGDNAELMGAWTSARNVLGPFKAKGGPDSGAGGSQTKAA